MLCQDSFHFRRINVFTSADDHVISTPKDINHGFIQLLVACEVPAFAQQRGSVQAA